MELRTTTVRKLLPESWGFLCPVHTPDGGPCGLLNHFTHCCRIVTHSPPDAEVRHAPLQCLVPYCLRQASAQQGTDACPAVYYAWQ